MGLQRYRVLFALLIVALSLRRTLGNRQTVEAPCSVQAGTRDLTQHRGGKLVIRCPDRIGKACAGWHPPLPHGRGKDLDGRSLTVAVLISMVACSFRRTSGRYRARCIITIAVIPSVTHDSPVPVAAAGWAARLRRCECPSRSSGPLEDACRWLAV